MTAPLFNLPITAPVTGGGAANTAGQAALGGFEALLAAFFGGEAQDAAAGLFGSALGKSDPAATEETKGAPEPPKDEATGVDPLAMAAMLLTTPAPVAAAAVAVAVADAALSGQDQAKAPAKSAQAFAPPAGAEAAFEGETALAADAASQEASDAAAAAVGQAIDAAAPETLAPLAKPPASKAGGEAEQPAEPKAGQEPKAPQHAAAGPAPVAHKAPVQPKEAPAPQAAALDEVVAASESVNEAQAPELAETQPHPAPRAGRQADAARRSNAGDVAAVAPPADDNVLPTAVTGAASAEAAGEPAAGVETETVAPTPAGREAKTDAKDADVPDFQMPVQASATGHAHSNAVAAHSQQARATSETIANLTAQIGKKLEGRSTKFDVELTPAGLGQVNIAVEIAASGKMTAAMSFETPQAAAELRARAHELQRALEQAGFDLSGGLSFDVAGDQGRQANQQQQHDGAAWRGRAFQAVLGTAGEAAETAATAALAYTRRSDTGVDVRV